MKAHGPAQSLVSGIKTALHKIADHHHELLQSFALRGHLGLMARGDEHPFVLLDFEDEFFLHSR